MRLSFTLLSFLLLFSPFSSKALTFEEVMGQLERHPFVSSQSELSESLKEKAISDSSLGDPMLMAKVSELPLETLSFSQAQRTEFMFEASKKISLSGRARSLREAIQGQAQSANYSALDRERQLKVLLWELAIERQSLISRKDILVENLSWLQDMLDVSNRLYSQGEIGQQNIFDLRIRLAELESEIFTMKQKIDSNAQDILYLVFDENVDQGNEFKLESVSWSFVDTFDVSDGTEEQDYQKLQLISQKESSEKRLKAYQRGRIPDPTLSVSYMKMNNMMGENDFVGFGVSFPLPVTQKTHSRVREGAFMHSKAQAELRNYKQQRRKNLFRLKSKINSLENELKVLKEKSLVYAKSSREITARAYQRGGVSYSDLQISETTLLKLQLRLEETKENLRKTKINYIYLKGGHLYANL